LPKQFNDSKVFFQGKVIEKAGCWTKYYQFFFSPYCICILKSLTIQYLKINISTKRMIITMDETQQPPFQDKNGELK